MSDVNWWLMALSFVLGLVLTWVLVVERVKSEVPVAVGAAKLAEAAPEHEAEPEPYGPGSVRVAAGGDAPEGYTIKGDENSMLYHTTDSPSYEVTIAEIWFTEEESAVRAGFTPWHKGRK